MHQQLFFFFKIMIIIVAMDSNIEKIIELYIRTQENPFRETDILPFLKINRLRIDREELHYYLSTHPLVLTSHAGVFLTRAGFFSEKVFSFKPERFEVEQGILVCGDRCMPFVDPEMLPHEINFSVNGKMLTKAQTVQNLSNVYSLYSLWGDEYIPQFFSLDPANENADFSLTDYELPPEIGITVHDASQLYRDWNFSFGDRILARVIDWHTGLVALEHVKHMNGNIFELSEQDKLREKWKKDFEAALEDSLLACGPRDSIDEQLVSAFLYDPPHLCVAYCASVSEVLQNSAKFEIGQYGVESRIWFKGEEIPAWGEWIDHDDTIEGEFSDEDSLLPVPDYVIQAYIFDSFFLKEEAAGLILEKIVPDFEALPKSDYNMLLLLLEKKRVSMRKEYNWFADYHLGEIRHRTLVLYSKLLHLVHDLENSGVDIGRLNQQQLVVLSQLVAHISRLIGSFTQEDFVNDKNLHALNVSLEGMEMSYDETFEVLSAEIQYNRKDSFKLVSNPEDKNGY